MRLFFRQARRIRHLATIVIVIFTAFFSFFLSVCSSMCVCLSVNVCICVFSCCQCIVSLRKLLSLVNGTSAKVNTDWQPSAHTHTHTVTELLSISKSLEQVGLLRVNSNHNNKSLVLPLDLAGKTEGPHKPHTAPCNMQSDLIYNVAFDRNLLKNLFLHFRYLHCNCQGGHTRHRHLLFISVTQVTE